MLGLLGEKLGMTQVYDNERNLVPVTVVRVLANVVTAIRTSEKNGYTAVQLGTNETKEKLLNRPQNGYFKKNDLKPQKWIKEFRVADVSPFTVGSEIGVSVLKLGDVLDVQGESKGKGFQGVMKRWHFSGGNDSHGCSVSHRVAGSIGQRAYPGKVMRGHKMSGHMGDKTVTIKNVIVFGIEAEQNLVLVTGNLPGAKGGRVVLYSKAADFMKRITGPARSDEAAA